MTPVKFELLGAGAASTSRQIDLDSSDDETGPIAVVKEEPVDEFQKTFGIAVDSRDWDVSLATSEFENKIRDSFQDVGKWAGTPPPRKKKAPTPKENKTKNPYSDSCLFWHFSFF